jgi:hypothetical protein
MHGTRAIQRIIEVLTDQPENLRLFSSYLQDNIPNLSKDINGNHVLQKVLATWSSHEKKFLYDAMIQQNTLIACHKHGCCIM